MAGLYFAKLREPAWRVHPNPTVLPKLTSKTESPPNRFDDPQRKYRVRYLATKKKGGFLEVLSRFRINDEADARLAAVVSVDEKKEPKLTPGAVPRDFLKKLQEVKGTAADPKLEFLDAAAPATHTALNKHPLVRKALKASGLGTTRSPAQLDVGSIHLGGPRGRPITQAISRVVYDETDAAGIRYTSRLDTSEPCWAIFDWVDMEFSKTTPINTKDAALKSAALSLGLTLP